MPYIKVQITTRGSAGSTEVMMRGIRNVIVAAQDDPYYYRDLVSVEIVTESHQQVAHIKQHFADSPIVIDALVVPPDYQTSAGTQYKARGLHYAVEFRRKGWNAKLGRTFIVHYDEESVLIPSELRKMMARLALTDKKLLEGPIYYPLEYMEASPLCRAMEANRPVGCFECRHVMEKGVPLHLHGSNLVVEEAYENEIGWDIGSLGVHPLISEDYVFGMKAFTHSGSDVFGWHGVVMLEQPPFSPRSAFKQRHRWVFGVLQGMAMNRVLSEFKCLPWDVRVQVVWGTRFRIATFALGSVVGSVALVLMPLLLFNITSAQLGDRPPLVHWSINLWLATVGALWLGSVAVGAWCNLAYSGLSKTGRVNELARALLLAPIAGIYESSAAMWAVIQWAQGRRGVVWQPTPKTKAADESVVWTDLPDVLVGDREKVA